MLLSKLDAPEAAPVTAVLASTSAGVSATAVGASFTFNVKLCVAFEPTPLAAPIVSAKVPPVVAAAVPPSAPVPAVKVMPDGNAPVSESVGVGVPVAVTESEHGVPTKQVKLLPLVIVGG